MYAITNKCFGILLSDAQQEDIRKENRPLVVDLLRWMAQEYSWDDVPESFEDPEVLKEYSESLGDESWGFSAYCGDGDAPLGLGFQLEEWASWELNDWWDAEGKFHQGFVSAVRKTATAEECREWLKKWDEVTKPIAHILRKHGVTPTVFYTSSTS